MLDVWQSTPPSVNLLRVPVDCCVEFKMLTCFQGPATGSQLQVLAPSSGSTEFSSVLTIDRPANRGVYPISFTLWHTGSYYTRITSAGMDIRGSPTTTTVKNSGVDPRASFATGTGIVGGVAGKQISIQIQAMDQRKPEVQTIMVSAASFTENVYGTFSIGFKKENSTSLSVSASALEVEAALEALYSIGDVTVVKEAYGIAGRNPTYSIWTVTFSGFCASELTCPTSLGDEPLMSVNTDNLLFNESISHQGNPTIFVTESAKGYAGNKRWNDQDLDFISVQLDMRGAADPVTIQMKPVHRMSCLGTGSGKFKVQFLNSTIGPFSTNSTVAQFEAALKQELKNVSVLSSVSGICNSSTSFTDLMFDKAVPLMQVIYNDDPDHLSVSFSTLVQAVDSVSVLESASGLYEIVYTPTFKGVYDVSVKISEIKVATEFTRGVYVTPALEYSASSTHNISQVNVEP